MAVTAVQGNLAYNNEVVRSEEIDEYTFRLFTEETFQKIALTESCINEKLNAAYKRCGSLKLNAIIKVTKKIQAQLIKITSKKENVPDALYEYGTSGTIVANWDVKNIIVCENLGTVAQIIHMQFSSCKKEVVHRHVVGQNALQVALKKGAPWYCKGEIFNLLVGSCSYKVTVLGAQCTSEDNLSDIDNANIKIRWLHDKSTKMKIYMYRPVQPAPPTSPMHEG